MNQSDKSGAMTIVLAEGIYSVGETTVLKPERRSFSKTERLTIRAEVLPDDPGWDIGRMPALIHTMPLPPTWNGRTDPLGGAAVMLIETTPNEAIRSCEKSGRSDNCARRKSPPGPRNEGARCIGREQSNHRLACRLG